MAQIAIVGLASIFPEAQSVDQFWDNIVQGRDCLRDVPPSRWSIADYYDPDPAAPDKTYCKRGGFIPEIDFDPVEFGLPPNVLEVTDVAQLLGLLVARQTFEDAGYGAEGRPFDRERTGVVLGVGGGQKLITPLTARLQYPVWERALKSCGLSDEETARAVEKIKAAYVRWEENSFPGLLGNVIAGRIANRFDLGGMNCVVDAACAASFAALKLAVSELAEGRCDLMLTGGVDTDNSIFMYMSFSKTPAFSMQAAPRPFDAASDGMMVGEGLGMLLLKRLEDAERDGDRIYAVIRGVGSSSDGRARSIYAPRSEGQARALRRAYAAAGVSPASVGLIEAHGTGTIAGDLCEVTTLTEVFGAAGAGRATVALGSVKSQIGHTKAAAGAAGLIKAALALHHKLLPPTLNVTAPNEKLGLDGSPFYLNTETRPWPRDGRGPRRAGVSAFGFGGTNFHVVLEEYGDDQAGAYRRHAAPRELLVWADTPEALGARCAELIDSIGGDEGPARFARLCREAEQSPPPADAARLGFVAASPDEARQLLVLAVAGLAKQPAAEEWSHPRGIHYRRLAFAPGGKVVALFAGQGAQHLGMGRELVLNFPELRRVFEHLDALFARDGQRSLSQVVFPPPAFGEAERARQAEAIQQTEYAQPAIGALSAGMYLLLRRAGLRPDAVAGHSFGEVTALWAAGVLADNDYAALVRARGRAMRPPADLAFDAGAMLAVAAGPSAASAVLERVPGLTIANYNAPQQLVLAGPRGAVDEAARFLVAQGVTATVLPVSAAFHTALVGHAQTPFAEMVRVAAIRPPQLPVYGNTTAAPYPSDPPAIQRQLCDHLLEPVRFQQQIERMYADGGVIFVEFGPRNILAGLVRQILGARPHLAVATGAARGQDSDRRLREAVVQLRVAGLALGPIDPYRHEQPPRAAARRRTTVRLNGSNFVSEKTRAAFEAALDDGFRIARQQAPAGEEQERMRRPMPDTTIIPTPLDQPEPAATSATPAVTPVPAKGGARAADRLDQVHRHQHEVLQLHQLYLTHQAEYAHTFMQLLQDQQRLLLEHGAQVAPAVLEHLERSVMALHQHQADTLRLHERYLADQHTHAQGLLQALHGPLGLEEEPPQRAERPALVAPAAQAHSAISAPAAISGHQPAPSSPPRLAADPQPAANGHQMEPGLSWSQPAPSPTPVFSPGPQPSANGREAEPGLSWSQRAPSLPPQPAADPQPAAGGHRPPPAPTWDAPAPVAPAAPASDHAGDRAPNAAVEQLSTTLLEVVTDLTGYPRETLELDMDMEGDLGIDSIKRVQILGVMQERFPALPPFKPETLAELRTLGQVLDHIHLRLGQTAAPGAQQLTSPSQPAPSSQPPQPPAAIPGAERSVPRLRPLPPPDRLETTLPEGSCCVITDDGTSTAPELAMTLQSLGWPAVVLRFPTALVPAQAPLPAGISRAVLHDTGEEQLEQALRAVAESYGPIAACIHLHPRPASAELFDTADQAIVRQVFLMARLLGHSLRATAERGRSCFVTVTRMDGALGTGRRGDYSAAAGGLPGLVKSLRHEWPQVFCRSLDLSPEIDGVQAARLIAAELYDPDRLLAEVGYGPEGRVTLVAAPAAYPA